LRAEEGAVSSISDPNILEIRYRVLDESFAAIVAARPISDPGIQMDIRIRLAEIILQALDGGEIDPAKLKQIAVRSFATAPEDVG
jgi:hypothetical protein